MVGFFIGLAVIGLLVIAILPRTKMPPSNQELETAEKEVQDLDPLMDPEEADEEFDDWGPGAPKTN